MLEMMQRKQMVRISFPLYFSIKCIIIASLLETYLEIEIVVVNIFLFPEKYTSLHLSSTLISFLRMCKLLLYLFLTTILSPLHILLRGGVGGGLRQSLTMTFSITNDVHALAFLISFFFVLNFVKFILDLLIIKQWNNRYY